MQTQALVLRAAPLKENDRLITALTKEHGLLRAFANGAAKPRSPLHGASQPFAHGTLEFYTTRANALTLKEGRAEGVFFDGLAADVTRLALANYWSALCIELCPREEPAPEQLRLMLNALHFLSTGLRPQALLKAVVELRLLCLAGYMPDLSGAGDYLDLRRGGTAASAGTDRVLLEQHVRDAMRYICTAPLERVFRPALPEGTLQALGAAAQAYLLCQTGKRFDELAYYQGIAGGQGKNIP